MSSNIALFIHSMMIHSIIVSGRRRLWSDCADAQADLGIRRPHMPDDTFSLSAAHASFVFKGTLYRLYLT